MGEEKKLISHSPEETISIGKNFAKRLKANDVVGLFGNLGTGKTQFVKGICEYFKVNDLISSPTFIIVNEYTGADFDKQVNINHFDLYRLKNIKELLDIGIESYINNNSICLIEWAELADECFKGNLKKVYFDFGKMENDRIIKFF